MLRNSATWLLGAMCAGAMAGCGGPLDAGEDPASTEQGLTCAPVSGTQVARSLAVTDATILSRFSFARTMQQVIATSGAAASVTPKAVFQKWMRSFDDVPGGCHSASVDPQKYGLVCPRTAEAQLATIDPFAAGATVKFVPVALFNRFDLAPASGATCGEYRIVYAMPQQAVISGRAFIIFEAALPNPNPAAGIDGCLSIARFWQNLTNIADVNSRAAKLDAFYYGGTAISGVGPVVDAANYGLAVPGSTTRNAGQIRTNFFISNLQWVLSEFKTRRTCGTQCSLQLDRVTVRNNPANELFDGSHANAAEFQTAFLSRVAGLAQKSVTGISVTTNNKFNEFESISLGASDVVYRNFATPAFKQSIQAKLTALGSTLTPNNILDRATTQTCAGCHELSNGAPLGGGLTWPASAKFVHVREDGSMSFALTNDFLPKRLSVLEGFINARCTGVAFAADVGMTLGGSVEGAAN